MIKQVLMAYVNAAAEAAMANDLSGSEARQSLRGSVIEVDLADYGLVFLLTIDEEGEVRVAELDDEMPIDADVIVRGSLLSFWRLAQNNGASKVRTGVAISGDIDKAQALQSWLAGLDIDWAGMAETYLGPSLAGLGEFVLRQGGAVLADAGDYAERELPVWLQHEVDLLPTGRQVTEFCDDVTALKEGLERLEARLGQAGLLDEEKAEAC